MDAETAHSVADRVLSEVAYKMVRRAGASAVAGDEDLPVLLPGINQYFNRFSEFHGVHPADLGNQLISV